MNFTLLHTAGIFFLGFFLGAIFGLGLHYLRSTPKSKQKSSSSASTRPADKHAQERELLPDLPETIVNERSQFREREYQSIEALQLTPNYAGTTIPEPSITPNSPPSIEVAMDFENTQDFNLDMLSEEFYDENSQLENAASPSEVDISKEGSIEEDATMVIPRK